MANTKITDLPTKQSVADSDYLVVDDGNTTYKAEKSKVAGSSLPHSFVGMVVQATNLTTEASVKAIYGDDTSWSLLSSVALASENVVGNGKALGLTDGTNFVGVGGQSVSSQAMLANATNAYGATIGATATTSSGITSKAIGVPTKSQLANNLNYSGLVANTITVYMWERTA